MHAIVLELRAVHRTLQGMVELEFTLWPLGGMGTVVPPTDVVGVCSWFHGEFEGSSPLSGPAPAELHARPEILRPEYGGGLDVFGPVQRIVR